MQRNLVFVYGTLRSGEENHQYMGSSQRYGSFLTAPVYAMYDLGPYPALIKGNQIIKGEIFEIDDDTLVRLDELEEVPVEYRRETIETPFGTAWIYLYQDESKLSQPIISGDWCGVKN